MLTLLLRKLNLIEKTDKDYENLIEKANLSFKRASFPMLDLKKTDTGHQSKFAFRHKVRKVNLSRGGKQGNEAFLDD